jgi:hypothetical protein
MTYQVPTVASCIIVFQKGLFDFDFMIRSEGGSARAEMVMDNGQTNTFSWYHDEITYSEADFLGKSLAEIREMHYQRDVAYLQS